MVPTPRLRNQQFGGKVMRYLIFVGVLIVSAVSLQLGPIGWLIGGAAWAGYGWKYWREPTQTAEPAE
jgi:hypothetical protein